MSPVVEKETGRQTDRETESETERETEKETEREAEKETERRRDREGNRKEDKERSLHLGRRAEAQGFSAASTDKMEGGLIYDSALTCVLGG